MNIPDNSALTTTNSGLTRQEGGQLQPRGPTYPLVQQPPQVIISRQEAPSRDTDAQYRTEKSKGHEPNQLPSFKLPTLLEGTIALIIMVLFFIGISMGSIALTSFSNSVDRHDRRHSNEFIFVE